jgi:hypothetical protein
MVDKLGEELNAIPHPRPFSPREKGGSSFLSPSGREVRSEGWTQRKPKENGKTDRQGSLQLFFSSRLCVEFFCKLVNNKEMQPT